MAPSQLRIQCDNKSTLSGPPVECQQERTLSGGNVVIRKQIEPCPAIRPWHGRESLEVVDCHRGRHVHAGDHLGRTKYLQRIAVPPLSVERAQQIDGPPPWQAPDGDKAESRRHVDSWALDTRFRTHAAGPRVAAGLSPDDICIRS